MSQATTELRDRLERRRAVLEEAHADPDIVVGKDILELLSSAMYLDPLTIFREYIQNAADAIDRAHDQGLLPGERGGKITVCLDSDNREVRIRDNGTGIEHANAARILTAFGASAKRGTTARGFRGVGRLAGLGLAQALVFRCKAVGEDVVTEVRWDCRRLKAILRDASYSGGLGDVVSEVVTVNTVHTSQSSEHFFEVVLERVVRIRNDVLLNEEQVVRYVRQVAPLPFAEAFPYSDVVLSHLAAHVAPCRFRILVNGSEEHLTKPYTDRLEVGGGRTDRFGDVELIKIQDSDGSVRAVGWLLQHEYLGAISGASMVRGLRARVGDIQIGDEDIFRDVFPEPRFNSWTVGELHIVDAGIVPNGRRDNFEQSPAYYQLVSELVPLARGVARKCRVSSARRNRVKRFEYAALKVEEIATTIEQGAITRTADAALRREAGGLLGEMERLVGGELIVEKDRIAMVRRIRKLRQRISAIAASAAPRDPLKQVPPKKRAVYEEVISLIYECSTNRVVAKALVDRITARLSTVA